MFCLFLFLAAEDVLGFEFTQYSIAEFVSPLEVCAVLSVAVQRQITVTLSTQDGTALGESTKIDLQTEHNNFSGIA